MNNISRYLIIGSILFMCINQGFSQAPNYQLPKIIPPSPTASAFERYGEIPVDMSTGVPQIEIPLYTIKSRQLAIPLSISYHAAGIRVDDISTPVGLGWVLKGMGLVSRTVLDRPDDGIPFDSYNNHTNKAKYKTNEAYQTAVSGATTMEQKQSLGQELYDDFTLKDRQSDRFSYQLPGKGGSTFRYNFITDSCVIMPYRPVHINKAAGANGAIISFYITDENGTRYLFDKASKTNYTGHSMYDSYEVNNSWYVTQIISADGTDQVEYQYSNCEDSLNYYSTTCFSHSVRWGGTRFEGSCIRAVNDDTYVDNGPGLISNAITAKEPLLKKIISATTVVTFDYTADRQDKAEDGYGHYAKFRLSAITVYDRFSNRKIKEISLDNNAYFGGNFEGRDYNGIFHSDPQIDISRRLKLKGVICKDNNGLSDKTYSFTYDESGTLPPYNSYNYVSKRRPNFSQDYWGYCNGADNAGLIPKEFLPCIPSNPYSCITHYGGTRRPDHNSAKACLIKEIQYPTGGKTIFEFEPNGEISYLSQTGATYGPGGGFRIKKIEHIADLYAGNNTTKTYQYSLPVARPLNAEMFRYSQTYFYYWGQVFCPPGSGSWNDLYLKSNSIITQSSSFSPLTFSSGTPVVYTQITEYNGTETANAGKTVYEYSPPPDTTLENNFRLYGSYYQDFGAYEPQMLSKKIYSNESGTYKLVHQTLNTYEFYRDQKYPTGINVVRNMTEILNGSQGEIPFFQYSIFGSPQLTEVNLAIMGYLGYIYYFSYTNNNAFERVPLLTRSLEMDFDQVNGNWLTNNTQYTYSNITHLQPTEKITINSQGDTLRTELKYPSDFSAQQPYTDMISRNTIIPVIEQKSYKNRQFLQSVKANYSYWGTGNNIIAPQTVESTVGNNAPEIRLRYYNYDEKGNALCVSKENDVTYAYLWGYNQALPIAEIANAMPDRVIFENFEENFRYPWENFGSGTTQISINEQCTGNQSLKIPAGTYGGLLLPLNNENFNLSGKYIFSAKVKVKNPVSSTSKPRLLAYVRYNNGASTEYFTPAHAGNTGGWEQLQMDVDLNGYPGIWYIFLYLLNGDYGSSNYGEVYFDDVRLYPDKALMTTYTYDPLIGTTSQTEPTGITTFYEHDSFGRLSVIRDNDRNIEKKISYNYRGQSINLIPGAFYNDKIDSTITRNDCGTGYNGSLVTYTVPAGKYPSTISQTVANRMARNEIKAKIQEYANQNGSCIPAFVNAAQSATFTKNNCPSGFTGTSYTYTVQAGRYRATTQAAADQLAIDELNANGQNYANMGANCYNTSWPFVKITYENNHTVHVPDAGGYDNQYYDIVANFYQDQACTIPLSVNNLVIHIGEYTFTQNTGSSNTNHDITASGASFVLFSNVMHFGYEGGDFVERYFTPQPGEGYNMNY